MATAVRTYMLRGTARRRLGLRPNYLRHVMQDVMHAAADRLLGAHTVCCTGCGLRVILRPGNPDLCPACEGRLDRVPSAPEGSGR